MSYFKQQPNGYRKGRSSRTPKNSLRYEIYEALNQKQLVIGVALDLSKVFDRVNQKILLEKFKPWAFVGIFQN